MSAAPYLALLVAIGIGLHNLGEGLAIGSAYAAGALALGHLPGGRLRDPQHDRGARDRLAARDHPPDARAACSCSALIAGAPAILGAWIGAAAFNPSAAALLFGVGVGAIAQVIVQLSPLDARRRRGGCSIPRRVGGLLAGIGLMYLTSLLVAG